MAAKRHEVDNQEIIRFNLKRENANGKVYTTEEFKALLHSMGYSNSSRFIACITAGVNPPFVRIERGKYTFCKNPVHIERLKKVWVDYTAYKEKPQTIENVPLKTLIEQAVTLLKNNGYKVLKPVTQYEECLVLCLSIALKSIHSKYMKRFKNPVFIAIIMAITLAYVFSMAHAQSVVLNGRQFSQVGNTKRGEAFDSITTYTYRDTNDSVYAVHLSKNLKAFIVRYSQRTGKPYRKYLPKVTEQLNLMR